MSLPPPPANPPLSSSLIPSLPPTAYYLPHFLTPHEESHLLQRTLTVPQPTWRYLSHRRLQAHPSPLSPQNILLDLPGKGLPEWLVEPVLSRLKAISIDDDGKEGKGIFQGSPHGAPNHCLVNEYTSGQGIHAHEDGAAYWPVVCTVSLGSHIVLDVTRKGQAEQQEDGGRKQKWRVLQEPRSLLISMGEMYTDCLHGIEGVEVDEGLNAEGIVNWGLLGDQAEYAKGSKRRETRISLTYRDVVRVKKVGKAFGGLMR